ncbi:Gfo/Idh/MocA family protein [Gorillibacterium sp. sgz5001074]|uniref:Gfo/Idh/MocA family protein n=1 Tax=Gorillibacterium sp. sgz5001074 TaxID=3446695 RepID=UPI003F67B59B
MGKIRIGIVGLGDIAEKAYLPVLASHAGVEIAGVASRSESTVERVGARYRIENRYTELDKLLALEPEAVFVHSPTETHHEIVLQCLRVGAAVYVDKPLSYEIGESEAMAEYADKTGRLLAVGFNRRFAPLYRQAKEYLDEAGGFELCAADKHRPRKQKGTAKVTLYDDLIHMVDLVSWLCGSQDRLEEYRQSVDGDGRLVYAAGRVPDASGSGSASFSMARGAGLDLERLELHGGGRSAQVVNLERAVFASAAEGTRETGFGSWDSVSYRRGFTGAVEHFLASLARPETCELRADRVMASHRLVERMLQRAGLS